MIKIALIVIISLALNLGTYFASGVTDREFIDCGPCAVLGEPATERGFPIPYADEVTNDVFDQHGSAESIQLSYEFQWENFLLNWLIWVGITSLIYFGAMAVLKKLGMTALLIYVVLSALGYSISVGTWF